MRYSIIVLIISFFSCNETANNSKKTVTPLTKVAVEILHTDSTSIRALDVRAKGIAYAGSNGHYGYLSIDKSNTEIKKGRIVYEGKYPAFRSIASTQDAFFMLSIESPALLYRYDVERGNIKLVYSEDGDTTFYDAMTFWNDQEGIAIGDPTEDCLSILITRDAGRSWDKLACELLPKVIEGEAAFAASDTNIKTLGDATWIVSGGVRSRVFYSGDKGYSWEVYDTPILQGRPTQGAYSVDFYDGMNGVIYGGDYTKPEENQSNIAITKDGGKTWSLVGQGANQGYKSCVQYVPNSGGKELVASGFTGISYSKDSGESWVTISDSKFLTFRFVNDTIAYAGGSSILARLLFKRQ